MRIAVPALTHGAASLGGVPIVADAPLSQFECLVAACLARPRDKAPRLVLTDYLEGDAERLVVLEPWQLAALRLPKGRWIIHTDCEPCWSFPPKKLTDPDLRRAHNHVDEIGITMGEVSLDILPRCYYCLIPGGLFYIRRRWGCFKCLTARGISTSPRSRR